MVKFFVTALLEVALLIAPAAAKATAATSASSASTTLSESGHILVLTYSPGDSGLRLRSIDGQTANVRLPLTAAARERLEEINSSRIWGPLLHTAAYYAAYVLLASTAVYFKNAELLTVTSLIGVPVLIVVSVRDLTKILTGNRINGPDGSWR